MTIKSYHLLSISLLLLLSTPIHAKQHQQQSQRSLELPPSVYFEQKADAQQVLLIQATSNGIASSVIEDICGTTTYYETTAIVLGVNRTVNPDATAIGAAKDGLVMKECDTLEFITYDLEKNEDGCVGPSDPGRKSEGWCGYVYFIEGVEGTGSPFGLAAGGRSFEEVDGSVCVEAMEKNCPDGAGAVITDAGIGISGSDVDIGDGGEDVAEIAESGGGILSIGCSVMIAALFSTATSLGI